MSKESGIESIKEIRWVPNSIIVFRQDEDLYKATLIEHDLSGYGVTPEQAMSELFSELAIEASQAHEEGRKMFVNLPRQSSEFLLWIAKKEIDCAKGENTDYQIYQGY